MNFSKTNSITVFPKSCTSTNICIDTCLIEKNLFSLHLIKNYYLIIQSTNLI